MKTEETGRDLHIDRVCKQFGSFKAVDDLSLDIAQGEFLTLLGPSGSGKTTLLMMIAGFVQPNSGNIFLDNRPIIHLPPEARNFGMVFQGYALFPHMSVFENVAFPLKVRKVPREEIKRRVEAALDLVQLRAKMDRLPRQLSGGQQQRVALARAMVFTPHLLLLDEPLSALDKKLRAELQDELKRLHRKVGLTFIYVTHDQDEALSMSDRIAIMRDGQLVQHGTPTDLYERPRTTFVADFLGKSNFIRGRVSAVCEGEFRFTTPQGEFLQKTNGPQPQLGADVAIAVRPEKMSVVGAGDEPGNVISGTVAEWNYFGSEFRLVVDAGEVGPIAVMLPAWRSGGAPELGQRLKIGWEPRAGMQVMEA
ncbi:ABC transporter ATP-binding protein [Microvirga sp. 17 mud 1-3]|uniref:ABC transporter ATP-binding protein n=1 Tax=Microvirga sp. 17 mud 1-3 TaxID=2082949 RepID=UPI000D6CE7D3|nr:ABC transporter ATP-binding protein [Microvirga sp. 17 mud 1-3]AWM86017.1 polyamine ABC transporter ATP-binding protein [Microvirga sp. 17 mud 1-3]